MHVNRHRRCWRTVQCLAVAFAVAVLSSGCASFATIDNRPGLPAQGRPAYSLQNWIEGTSFGETTLILAFSGGGSRAAALAYGVMTELRDTVVRVDGQPRRLLDEVDLISAVSGGSFTAAYYGLHGDRLFTDFKKAFLRRNVSGELLRGLLKPTLWFSRSSRTDMAVDYYEARLFKGATFADLLARPSPLIVINASDLGLGVRFAFLQEYFDLLCSDLSSFPLARAVTASSAVPVLFNPVVLENFEGCRSHAGAALDKRIPKMADSPQLNQIARRMQTYQEKEKRRYIQLVDGGITDNLGLRAIYETIEIAGGVDGFISRRETPRPSRLAIISVNASTIVETQMEQTTKTPTMEQTINAVLDTQIHRYNAVTLELVQRALQRWAKELSTPDAPMTPYFIQVDFEGIAEPDRRMFFNQIPTTFSLTAEQADRLIAAGRALLRANPEFQRLIEDVAPAGDPPHQPAIANGGEGDQRP